MGEDEQPGQRDAGAAAGSFRAWLSTFAHVNAPIGDLARDVAADEDWPDGPESLEELEAHLLGLGASQAALETLRAAWERYSRG